MNWTLCLPSHSGCSKLNKVRYFLQSRLSSGLNTVRRKFSNSFLCWTKLSLELLPWCRSGENAEIPHDVWLTWLLADNCNYSPNSSSYFELLDFRLLDWISSCRTSWTVTFAKCQCSLKLLTSNRHSSSLEINLTVYINTRSFSLRAYLKFTHPWV